MLGDAQMSQALYQYHRDALQRRFDKARQEGRTASLTIYGYLNERSIVNTELSLGQRAILRCALSAGEMNRLMSFLSEGADKVADVLLAMNRDDLTPMDEVTDASSPEMQQLALSGKHWPRLVSPLFQPRQLALTRPLLLG
jgi:hypothetical protein